MRPEASVADYLSNNGGISRYRAPGAPACRCRRGLWRFSTDSDGHTLPRIDVTRSSVRSTGKQRWPPEFWVLPPRQGSAYSALQILTVLRALRFNDYFMSLSFRDIDFGDLWALQDCVRQGNTACMNRRWVSCLRYRGW